MRNAHKVALSLGLLALPILTYAGEASELEKLQQEINALRLENQSLRDSSTTKDTAVPDANSTAQRNLEPTPAEPAMPAWKPEWMKDVTVTLGTKVWVNKWDGFYRNSGKGQGGDIYISHPDGSEDHHIIYSGITDSTLSINAEESITPIPTLNVRYKQLFAAASYYSETQHTFDPFSQYIESDIVEHMSPDGTVTPITDEYVLYNETAQISAKRTEWDFTVGYSLTPNIALITGYKSVREKFNTALTYKGSASGGIVKDNVYAPEITNTVFDVGGPLLGISLSAPLTNGFGAYFNYMHGFMDVNYDDNGTSKSSDGNYDLVEGGLAYAINGEMLPAGVPLSSATLFAGYRYQSINVSDIKGGNDTTQGFATGINLSF